MKLTMGAALIAISVVFAVGGFACLYEERSQADELAYQAGVITAQAEKLKADDQLIGDMGAQCQ